MYLKIKSSIKKKIILTNNKSQLMNIAIDLIKWTYRHIKGTYFIEEHNITLEYDTVDDVKQCFEDMTDYYDQVVKDCDEDEDFYDKPDLKCHEGV